MTNALLEWRTCQGFSAYQVSDRGDLRVISSQKRLKGYITFDGYIAYRLTDDLGGRTEAYAHVLVLEAFVGPKPSKHHQGAHSDGSRLNNHPSNLRWATPLENQRDRAIHGTAPAGVRNGRAKLTEADVRFIRSEYRQIKTIGKPRSVAELEVLFGLHRSTVVNIARGRAWPHVPMDEVGG